MNWWTGEVEFILLDQTSVSLGNIYIQEIEKNLVYLDLVS